MKPFVESTPLGLAGLVLFCLIRSCSSLSLPCGGQIYLMGLVNNPETSQGLKLWQGLDPSWEEVLRYVRPEQPRVHLNPPSQGWARV